MVVRGYVEGQIGEDVGYYVGEGGGSCLGDTDGPGVGAQFGEVSVYCVSVGVDLVVGGEDGPRVGIQVG